MTPIDQRLLFSHSLFHGQPCAFPCFGAAEQSGDIIKSFGFQFLRRTGACMLSRSRAVRDDRLVVGQFARTSNDGILWDIDRTLDMLERV
jgi:hypothetical protein